MSGGEVQGEYFYCAAILGSPALWAPAREAMRTGKIKLAWQYGRRALKRAFSGRLRFTLDGGEKRRTEALVLISPMISKAMEDPIGLEAAAMDPSDATQAFRLAATALFLASSKAVLRIAGRKRLLHRRYLSWSSAAATEWGAPPIPAALERVIHRSLLEAAA